MTIKSKMSLGLGFLFVIIFALAFFFSYYIEKLSKDSENILKDNYNSLIYARNMQSSADDIKTAVSFFVFNKRESKDIDFHYRQNLELAQKDFEKNFNSEKNNITEINEKEYVEKLGEKFIDFRNICENIISDPEKNYLNFSYIVPAYDNIKQILRNIFDVNMQAIERKSNQVKSTSEGIVTSMVLISVLCIILALFYFMYFPNFVANTISVLADRSNNILEKLGLKDKITSNDEFQVLNQSFNLIETKLDTLKK